tara:strand:- start:862 stop:1770 length:909 start_codon:yes stop_codon:yes gene_type:complete
MPRKTGSHPEFLKITFDTIMTAADDHSSRWEIVDNGGIETVLEAMKMFRNDEADNNNLMFRADFSFEAPETYVDAQLQITALKFLRVLSSQYRYEIGPDYDVGPEAPTMHRKLIADAGGIEVILDTFRQFPYDVSLHENVCLTLVELVGDSRDYKRDVVKAGGVKLIVQAMQYLNLSKRKRYIAFLNALKVLLEDKYMGTIRENVVEISRAWDMEELIKTTFMVMEFVPCRCCSDDDDLDILQMKTLASKVLNLLIDFKPQDDPAEWAASQCIRYSFRHGNMKRLLKLSNEILREEITKGPK